MQQHGLLLSGRFATGVLLALLGSPLFLAGTFSSAADRIILRDLSEITDRTVRGFSADGVALDDGTVLGWDRIERAEVDPNLQAEFDKALQQLGRPLSIIRRRLEVEDHRGLLSHAAALYPAFRDRRSPTSYMVIQALMWAHLARGEREEALEPYLLCYEYLRGRDPGKVELPGPRRLRFDPRTGLTPELAPIWFDAERAGERLSAIQQVIRRMRRPRPEGAFIYYATMAVAAGEPDKAEPVLQAIKSESGPVAELKQIVLAQREVSEGRVAEAVAELTAGWDRMSDANQPLALYWLGNARLLDKDRAAKQAGLLWLLRIPSDHGEKQPHLAAAALHRAMTVLAEMDDSRGSVAVRNELIDRFGQTLHADLARSNDKP